MNDIPFPGDSYVTEPGGATFFASRFPSLYFFFKVGGIIRHDGNLATAGKYRDKEWTEGSMETLRALERTGVTFHVDGMRNIDAVDGPCVFIGNHMSTLETFVLPVFIQPRKNVTFVVKDSLMKYPWFGPVLQTRNPVVVSRTNPRQDLQTVLEGGVERIRQGRSVIVFPQSTRSTTLDTTLFNSIGVKLAKRAGVPLIPLALRSDAWGMGKIIKDIGKVNPRIPVHFSFGKPREVEGNGKAQHAEVCDFIASRLRDWRLPQEKQGGL